VIAVRTFATVARVKRPQHLAHATAVLAVSALAAPATAAANGLAGSDASSVSDFLGLGFQHMLLGWDHLLFAAGVILLAGEPRRAAKLVSLFVLGHSTTLMSASSSVRSRPSLRLRRLRSCSSRCGGREQHWPGRRPPGLPSQA